MLNIKQMLQGSANLELHNGMSCSTVFVAPVVTSSLVLVLV